MLFNSYGFIFLYLPVVLLGFFWLARFNHAFSAGWLALSSLFFYGYWNFTYVGLLLGSVVCNYTFGVWIAKAGVRQDDRRRKQLLVVAISANLSLLGYYKYANFFVDSLNNAAGTSFPLGEIILPLGISFFTFTQIAFLVDTYQGKVKEYNFVHYTLFVTYFPHLIAGPVLHHKEMMPQFANPSIYRFNYENMAVGGTIFFIGLFKKVVLADSLAFYVKQVFDIPPAYAHIQLVDAWIGAMSYTLQIYFDFSGYSDMAIGLSRLFGIVLPLNFHSPYKSVNIIEFWRRWHMTLSRFLREYLYIPLGGNRKGGARRYFNLLATMLLGGLWHGAGWTFVIWGVLHGVYLVINHSWHGLRKSFGQNPAAALSKPMHALAVLATFLAVVVAWVIFRADSTGRAILFLKSMSGMHGTSYSPDMLPALYWIAASLFIAWFAPNTQQIMGAYRPALGIPEGSKAGRMMWQPSRAWLAFGVLVSVSATLYISELSTFIYFQF